MYLFKLTQKKKKKKTTEDLLINAMVDLFYFAQSDLREEPLCLLHIGSRGSLTTSRRETYMYVKFYFTFEDGERICTFISFTKRTATINERCNRCIVSQ